MLGWDNAHFDSGADALASVLESVRLHGVSLPGHICAVVVTTLILEGWSNQLDPSHSVLTQVGHWGDTGVTPQGASIAAMPRLQRGRLCDSIHPPCSRAPQRCYLCTHGLLLASRCSHLILD